MLSIKAVSKNYGKQAALLATTLDIQEGEFFSLLGPSGCGKTTLLRIIGGQEQATQGKIMLDGVDLTECSPAGRPLNMIFQRLALFPHLSVRENIAFGLRVKKVEAAEIRKKVAAVLELTELPAFADRAIATLSGGQQQRVAIARALVNEPKILLLDEPLSALDEKLRQKMQIELRTLQKKLNMTFIFVTHAQEEALSFSDRVAVMNAGQIEQIGTPEDIYFRPQSPFVSGFIGSSNFIQGTYSHEHSSAVGSVLIGETKETKIHGRAVTGPWRAESGSKATLVIRPEHVQITAQDLNGSDLNSLRAVVCRHVFRGEHYDLYCRLELAPHCQLIVRASQKLPPVGSAIFLKWNPDDAQIMKGHHV